MRPTGSNLRRYWTPIWDFIRRDEALTATEYAVMLALIVCLCMGPVQTLGCNANRTFTNTSNSIGS
jgi:pilus assembly protein Flp/PilA